MVFNWFRRQQEKVTGNQPEAEAAPSSTAPAPQAEKAEIESDDQAPDATASPDQPSPAEPATSSDADEMLQWAKAAYANIQNKEAQPTTTEQPEPQESTTIAEQEETAAIETVDSKPAEPEATEPKPATSLASDLTSDSASELEPEQPETLPEPVAIVEADNASNGAIDEAEPAELVEQADLTEQTASISTDRIETAVSPAEPEQTAIEPKAQVSQAETTEINETVEPEASEPAELVETAAIDNATTIAPEVSPEESIETATALDQEPEATQSEPESISEPEPEEIQVQPEINNTQTNAESDPTSAPTPPPKPAIPPTPTVDFDEGFLWSAEVLAAQGRRPEDVSSEEIVWLKQLRQGLTKTRLTMVNRLKAAVGKGPLDQEAIDDLEALLLQADVGVQATDKIITALQDKLEIEDLPAEEAIAYLKQLLRDMLDQPTQGKGRRYKPTLEPERNQLNIWLITGVNGAGKTTTIGKIAHLSRRSGYKTIIAAADTFRAAAVEQVKVWGDRAGVEVIANPGQNTDPAAVVFDAIGAAQSRNSELLLVDTAGRLQNKKNLMDELSKIRRIVNKKANDAKIESLLVLDSTLGQNGLRQAEVFSKSAEVSGVVLTKLDGSAKGGVALAVVQQLKLPIRFIGAGEGIEDLRPFSSYEFVEALLSN
ncbi:signal recognition particle-docking protein FtsY [Thalassoporum mexicanum PCC 7367]|uniref:signal recognition particle-docking protein FtsY n=1 Tax=Thalassoporum mexicanum TaxID=3457544 RepID=UPI00029FBBE1|nr:signal recognition particle-docking protein FtsY [Pseudanabaena sp. PCC 7367]AFY68409.1 signal recognition particle-docking protein FtsY [Pseudanabaena sp. PCC 7367]